MGAVWRSDKTSQDGRNKRAPSPKSSRTSAKGRRKTARRLALLAGISLLAGGGYLGWQELDSARWQSHWLRDRKSVGWGKRVSVRVDLGGRRSTKKQTAWKWRVRP